jgi:RNA polymerase sigma factor (sigma-70 family)
MAFETDTDADLLGYMAMEEDDPGGARAAWGAFFVRHRESVFRHVRRAYGSQLGGDAGAADVCAETFRRAFDKASTFSPRAEDPEVVRRQVVAWLCKIAKSIFRDLLRKRAKLPVLALVEDVPSDDDPDGEVPTDDESEQLARAKEAWAELDDRERTVLVETMEWFNNQTGASQMPKGVAKELADRLGTTTANLRQIRRRALAKFEARLGVVLQARADT